MNDQEIGNYTGIGTINKLNSSETGYAYGIGTFYFPDGNISFIINFRDDKYQLPQGLSVTTVSNASGAYFSYIGNKMTIEVNNITLQRIITIKE